MHGYDSETVEVITDMMTENTGTHMLDSGGAYGRHWQRNQGRDFTEEEPVTLDVTCGYVNLQLNTFHYLCENLTFDEDMQEAYDLFTARSEDCHLIDMEAFAEWMHENKGAAGIYGDGEPITVNTYNEENLLDQTLQFVYMEYNDETYIGLQVHGGCDVRGGYTAPKWFTYSGCSEGVSFLTDYRGGCTSIYAVDSDEATVDGVYWTTDDAHSWYREGAAGLGAGTELQEYTWVSLDDFNDLDVQDGIEGNENRDEDGLLLEDVVVYCEDTNRAWIQDSGDILELKV